MTGARRTSALLLLLALGAPSLVGCGSDEPDEPADGVGLGVPCAATRSLRSAAGAPSSVADRRTVTSSPTTTPSASTRPAIRTGPRPDFGARWAGPVTERP